mgnify:FL=1
MKKRSTKGQKTKKDIVKRNHDRVVDFKAPPEKLTDLEKNPGLTDLFEEALARGMPFKEVCRALDVSYSAAREWMRRGMGTSARQDGEQREPFISFAMAFNRGKSRNLDERITRINAQAVGGQVVERTVSLDRNGNEVVREKFARGDWRADAWMLEREWPKLFGPQAAAGIVVRDTDPDDFRDPSLVSDDATRLEEAPSVDSVADALRSLVGILATRENRVESLPAPE